MKTHLKVTTGDYRGHGQTQFEYTHSTACGYVRDLVTRNIADVTCKICLHETPRHTQTAFETDA